MYVKSESSPLAQGCRFIGNHVQVESTATRFSIDTLKPGAFKAGVGLHRRGRPTVNPITVCFPTFFKRSMLLYLFVDP